MAEITKEQLEEFYINQGLSLPKCAKALGRRSSSGILYLLRKYGIKTRKKGRFDHRIHGITKAQLENLYVEQGLSVRECAKVLGLPSHGAISKRLSEFGIKTRPSKFQEGNQINKGRAPEDCSGWKGGKKIVLCDNCGEELPKFPSLISETNFCDSICKGEWLSQDMTGKRIGLLTIIKQSGRDQNDHILWECLCDCGNIKPINTSTLANVKSCGCQKHPKGEKSVHWKGVDGGYGYDTALSTLAYAEDIRPDPDVLGRVQVKCLTCNEWFTPTINQVSARIYALTHNARGECRFYCSDECKKQCSIYRQEKYPKDFKPESIRNEILDPDFREMVLIRDSYRCQKCDSLEDLEVHHIEGVAQEPMLANDLDNCLTVCHDCHVEIHEQPGCTYYDYQREACEDNKEAVNQITI